MNISNSYSVVVPCISVLSLFEPAHGSSCVGMSLGLVLFLLLGVGGE